jgi:hypothetical protein
MLINNKATSTSAKVPRLPRPAACTQRAIGSATPKVLMA